MSANLNCAKKHPRQFLFCENVKVLHWSGKLQSDGAKIMWNKDWRLNWANNSTMWLINIKRMKICRNQFNFNWSQSLFDSADFSTCVNIQSGTMNCRSCLFVTSSIFVFSSTKTFWILVFTMGQAEFSVSQ